MKWSPLPKRPGKWRGAAVSSTYSRRPWTAPVGIELWGDQVDSLRRYDPATQRSAEAIDPIRIGPAEELLLPSAEAARLLDLVRAARGSDAAREQAVDVLAELAGGVRAAEAGSGPLPGRRLPPRSRPRRCPAHHRRGTRRAERARRAPRARGRGAGRPGGARRVARSSRCPR